ncbi:hypothetical protein HFO98_03145 [Rhizobium leguminosarum]|uniref:hypothetical protein n=1 Tax=Rhizobium leguminosarum TaxID=384 RepID=UPI001C9487BC|nr:hypothetical protein [Rhizobium leguminosarum]MBY5407474.1 hypothetical protein [Rhizobium leguminosarum]
MMILSPDPFLGARRPAKPCLNMKDAAKGERLRIHFAQEQSRLRSEKPIGRQYQLLTIAPWLENNKIDPDQGHDGYGL